MIPNTITTSCSYFAFKMVPNHSVSQSCGTQSAQNALPSSKPFLAIVVQYLILRCSPTVIWSEILLNYTLMLYCIGCRYFILYSTQHG